jgi:hypothetical protein
LVFLFSSHSFASCFFAASSSLLSEIFFTNKTTTTQDMAMRGVRR